MTRPPRPRWSRGFGWAGGLQVIRGSLYFSANDGQHGLELYRI
jgi:hypothetical protein